MSRTASAAFTVSVPSSESRDFDGHPLIVPAELSDVLVGALRAGLAHRVPLNRHVTTLVRAAADPAVAHALFRSLCSSAARVLSGRELAEEWTCPTCAVESYVKSGLLEPGDEVALLTAQTRAAVTACGFGVPPTEDELALLHHSPEALVRAAYAVARCLD